MFNPKYLSNLIEESSGRAETSGIAFGMFLLASGSEVIAIPLIIGQRSAPILQDVDRLSTFGLDHLVHPAFGETAAAKDIRNMDPPHPANPFRFGRRFNSYFDAVNDHM